MVDLRSRFEHIMSYKNTFAVFFLCMVGYSAYAQQPIVKPGKKPGTYTVSAPKGTRLPGTFPKETSEHMKKIIAPGFEGAKLEMRLDPYRKGRKAPNSSLDGLVLKETMKKDERFVCEIVPEISADSTRFTLFTFFPSGGRYSYMFASAGHTLRYVKFAALPQNATGLVPVVLCYEDDEDYTATKKIAALCPKDASGCIDPKYRELLLKELDNCMLMYYTVSK